jgi:hypothetical protein
VSHHLHGHKDAASAIVGILFTLLFGWLGYHAVKRITRRRP